MKKFDFLARIEPGRISFGSEFNRGRFLDWTKKNAGGRVGIALLTPESGKQRRWYEGALVPLVTFFQEGLNHRDNSDCASVREWLKLEFNPSMVKIGGKLRTIGGTTKGELNEGFVEKITDWLEENYGINAAEILNPKEYEYWRDVIFSEGGPETYIDWLVEMKKLKIPEEKL